MKHRRFLALILSLILTSSLTVPAWAVEEDSETADFSWVEAYAEDHPGELEALTTEQLLAWLGYTETLTPAEQFMKNWDLSSEEEVRPALLEDYVSDRLHVEETHADFLEYQATWAEEWAGFDADAYFAEENAYYYDKEEYMNLFHLLTEEEFAEAMFVEYISYYQWEKENGYDWYQPAVLEPSLVVNGKRYAGDSFALIGDTAYLGTDELSAILGVELENAQELTAIRPAAEAAGWDVVWNEYHLQVILLDREKLMTGYILPDTWEFVPCDFSGYTELAKRLNDARPGEGRSVRAGVAADVALTLMDSLDGDQTYRFGLTADTLTRDLVSNMDLSLDLSALKDLLGEELLDQLLAPMTKLDRQTLKENLGAVRARAIWNQEDGTLAWTLPFLSLLDPSMDPETWYIQDTGVTASTKEEFAAAPDLSEELYASLLEDCATTRSGSWMSAGESSYMSFLMTKSMANAAYGENAITRNGDDLVWDLSGMLMTLWGNTYSSLYYDYNSLEVEDLFKELTCRVTVAPDGAMTLSMDIRPDMEAVARASADEWTTPAETALIAFLLDMMDFRYTAEGQVKGGTGTAHLEFHLKNQFKLTVDISSEARETTDLPLSAPPEGAPVQDL